MAKKAKVLGEGDQVDKLDNVKKAIAAAAAAVNDLKLQRQDINEGIAAKRSHLEALGIAKPAFDMALRYAGWDPDKRKGFDLAYAIVRDAIGLPFNAQGDLFEAADKRGGAAGDRAEQVAADLEPKPDASMADGAGPVDQAAELAEGEAALPSFAKKLADDNAEADRKIRRRQTSALPGAAALN